MLLKKKNTIHITSTGSTWVQQFSNKRRGGGREGEAWSFEITTASLSKKEVRDREIAATTPARIIYHQPSVACGGSFR